MRGTDRPGFVVALATAVVLVGVTGGAAAWATSYDRRTSNELLPGTEIQGIPVGALTANQAVRVLKDKLEAPLHRPITVRTGSFQTVTSPWDLGLRVDVRAAVRQAQGEATGNLVTRVWRRLFSHPQRVVSAAPRWQTATLDGVLTQLAGSVHVDPVAPTLDGSTGWIKLAPGKPGTDLDVDRSRDAITDAIQLGDPSVTLSTTSIPASADAPREAILVRTGENKLYLYRDGSIVKDWPVATGSAYYATPTGTWKIVEKVVDPVWYNPGSAWATGLPARIGPGPSNPLGTHALALDAPAILIHATPDRASIGYNVSHGCIRMLEENEREVFDQVEVGTPVVVVDAGSPQDRTVTPTTANAAQAAAVQF